MAAGGILYVVLGMVVNNNLDDVLKEKRDKINGSLTTIQSVAQIADSPDKTVTIRLVFRAHLPNTYSDTVTFDTDANENISYRRLTFDKLVQGERYEISICLSKLETEDLVQLIFYFMVGLLAVIVAILFFLNRWLTAGAWSPFYKTLEQLNAIKIGQEENIAFGNSPVDEFAELNRSLAAMVQKAQSDFRNLKEFTENASHEIQTPIAIIKSKLESVLQDKALSPQRYRQIQSAYESASRLAKLNEALLLLSKIENRQFGEEFLCDIDLSLHRIKICRGFDRFDVERWAVVRTNQ